MILRSIQMLRFAGLNPYERKTILFSSLGSMLEFYDIITFSFMCLYIDKTILHGTILSSWSSFILFSVFLLGYLCRPIGMLLYSKYIIHYSSSVTNLYTITLIVSYCAIGLISGHDILGYTSLVTIISARIMQGIAFGAEMQSQYDHLAVKLNRNAVYSILGILAANELGQLLGVASNRWLNHLLTDIQMENFGWRIPFFIGAVFTLVIYLLRIYFSNPITTKNHTRQVTPAYKLFINYPTQSAIAVIISGVKGCTTFLILLFIPYLLFNQLNYDYDKISSIVFQATLLSTSICLIFKRQVNFNNAAKIMKYCILLLIPSILFWAWSFYNSKLILISVLPLACLASLMSLLIPRIIAGLFPHHSVLSGVALCHQTGFVVLGGLSPLFTILITHLLIYHLAPQINKLMVFLSCATFYVLVISAAALLCLSKLKKYANYQDLNLIRQHLQENIKRRK